MRLVRDESALSAYLDEMLDARGMRKVQDLMDREPQARERYSSISQTVECLRQLPEPEPPPDFWPDTYRALRHYAASRQCRRPLCRAARGLLLVAVAALLLAGAVRLAGTRAVAAQPVNASLTSLER